MRTDTAKPDPETLSDLNRDYIRSVQTSDVRRFDEILADHFLCSNPDGSLVDRSAFLKQTAPPVKISNLEAHGVNIRLMGDFAIIHARTTYTAPDGRPGGSRYADVGPGGRGAGSPSPPTLPAADGRALDLVRRAVPLNDGDFEAVAGGFARPRPRGTATRGIAVKPADGAPVPTTIALPDSQIPWAQVTVLIRA